jgi:hypothetical protein
MTVRTINSAQNPKWADASNTMIDLEVDFDELDELYVPFTAQLSDPEEWGRTLFENAVNGDYGEVAAWVVPSNISGEDALNKLRLIRDERLRETDYIEMPTKWATLTTEKQAEWATYRNALRDMPATYPNAEYRWSVTDDMYILYNVTWPTIPDS